METWPERRRVRGSARDCTGCGKRGGRAALRVLAVGGGAQASNFLRALRQLREAAALGLLDASVGGGGTAAAGGAEAAHDVTGLREWALGRRCAALSRFLLDTLARSVWLIGPALDRVNRTWCLLSAWAARESCARQSARPELHRTRASCRVRRQGGQPHEPAGGVGAAGQPALQHPPARAAERCPVG